MEERGLGEPGANSTVREEWEPKGTDVIQLKIRVQGFSQTLEKKVSEQPGILRGSRGSRESPRQLWSQLRKTWDIRHTAGSGWGPALNLELGCCVTLRERALTLELESRAQTGSAFVPCVNKVLSISCEPDLLQAGPHHSITHSKTKEGATREKHGSSLRSS